MIEEATELKSNKVRSKRARKLKALIFNQYLETAGGGERLCFEIASALESAGYEINFVVAGDLTLQVESLARAFGITPKSKWSLFNVKTTDRINDFCKSRNYDVFVNNTYESFLENPAPVGLYVTMFPKRLSSSQQHQIASYDIIYCISNFTELYTLRRWGGDKARVVVPPISEINFSHSDVSFSEKEKLVICVGRFNVYGHSKNQLEAIKAFVSFQESGLLGPDWRLVVAGRVNAGEQNLRYLGECVKAATQNVTVLEGLPLPDLVSLYRRASLPT